MIFVLGVRVPVVLDLRVWGLVVQQLLICTTFRVLCKPQNAKQG